MTPTTLSLKRAKALDAHFSDCAPNKFPGEVSFVAGWDACERELMPLIEECRVALDGIDEISFQNGNHGISKISREALAKLDHALGPRDGEGE